jgi:hypothetical protein
VPADKAKLITSEAPEPQKLRLPQFNLQSSNLQSSRLQQYDLNWLGSETSHGHQADGFCFESVGSQIAIERLTIEPLILERLIRRLRGDCFEHRSTTPGRSGTTAFQADVGFERLGYDCNGAAAAPAPVSATRKFPPRDCLARPIFINRSKDANRFQKAQI